MCRYLTLAPSLNDSVFVCEPRAAVLSLIEVTYRPRAALGYLTSLYALAPALVPN
jgi:hypothetical protein